MNLEWWTVSACIAALAGTGMSLFYLRAAKIGIPAPAILVCGMFSTAVVSLALIDVSKTSLNLPVVDIETITAVCVAIICCYAGNISELQAIIRAPNAGYALAVSKSYAILTLIAAWMLFGNEISGIKIAGVALVVIFQVLARESWKKNKKDGSAGWKKYAVISFFGLAGLSLAGKYLMIRGMGSLEFLAVVVSVTGIMIVASWRRSGNGRMPNLSEAALPLICIGLISAAVNYFLYSAIALAPNVGYVNAINTAQIALTAIISRILFKSELGIAGLIGIVGIIVGILLVILPADFF